MAIARLGRPKEAPPCPSVVWVATALALSPALLLALVYLWWLLVALLFNQ